METRASKTRNAPEPTPDSPESNSEPHQPTTADLFALLSCMNRRLDVLENSRSSTPSGHSADSEDSLAEQADRPPVLTVRPNTLRDPKMAPPEPFSGKISEFKNFMVQCTLIFSVCPNTYCTDERRVLFVISRLKDEPLTWANEIAIDPAHPLRHNYERFKQQLTNIYGDRAFKAKSEDQLLSLRQTSSAALYAQKFQSYAVPLNINDDTKYLMFFGGLKSDIQKACTMAGCASPFYALVDQAITFDQLSYQHSKRESGNSSESGGKKQRRQDGVPTKDSSLASNPKSQSSSRPRGPLTPAEKDYRTKHNLCMYCGKPGHTVQDCTNAPKPPDSSSSASVSLFYPVPTSGSENWQSQPSWT